MNGNAFEESLSRVVGDVLAHRIAAQAAAVSAWRRQAGQRLAENVAEYLGNEVAVCVPRHELAGFAAAVDKLNGDLDQLQARLDSLDQPEETA